uniref:Acid phosphatase n=1 Tax=Opuntia streptacantha TaxID=393608 RepID=A0A7C8YKW1_OPUST
MECAAGKWNSTIIFFIFLVTSIYFLHSLLLGHVTVNFDGVTLKSSPELPLRFRSGEGIFKILQVADMHYGQGAITRCRDVPSSEFKFCSDLNTTVFLQRLIEAEKPDFVAFTGDNIFGSSTPDAAESLFQAFGLAAEYRIPWAAILGNHDQESTMDREELMSLISLMDYSVSQVNPMVRDPSGSGEEVFLDRIDGFGNYNLMVYGAYGSPFANNSVLNLVFLDSGDRFAANGRGTYGWIRESQLDWLRGLTQEQQRLLFFKKDSHSACFLPYTNPRSPKPVLSRNCW